MAAGYYRRHFSRSAGGVDFTDQRLSKTCVPISFAATLPILGHLVVYVVLMGAYEEMRGAAASFFIAGMAHKKTVRDGTEMNLPRSAVGAKGSSLVISVHQAIAIPASCPKPARAKFRTMGRNGAVLVDARPKPLGERPSTAWGAGVAGWRAEPAAASLDFVDGCLKRRSAVFANARNGRMRRHADCSFSVCRERDVTRHRRSTYSTCSETEKQGETMKNLAIAVAILLLCGGVVVACPNVVVHNRAVSAPYVSPVVVSEVYPSTATTSTEIHVTVTQALYSAFLAPAVVVPYVAPPLPPPVVVPQIPLVPAAIPAAPVCPPATMPAPVAPAVSEDFCKLVLQRLDHLDGRLNTMEARLKGDLPPPVTPPPMSNVKPDAAAPHKYTFLAANCAACHTEGKMADKAPAFFDAAGDPRMTQAQLVKARKKVKSGKMPPPESAQGKAATQDGLNGVLDDIDAAEEATVETVPVPAPPPAPAPKPVPVPNP